MKKANNKRRRAVDLLPEYDFRGGVRGKYAKRFSEGTNVVVLAPDVAKLFPDSESVNRALRACGEIVRIRGRAKSG
jgi:hypothetical protein